MIVTHSWGRRLAPIIVIQIFLWLTLALFAFGPWQWPLRNPGQLYLFVCGAHLALLFGYLSAAHRSPKESPSAWSAQRLVRWSLWATVLILPITSYARTGHWIPDVMGGLLNPGKAYMELHQAEEASNAGSYLRILAAPLLAILFPLAFYLGRSLPMRIRIVTITAVVVVLLMALATGQRRDMADLLVTTPFIILASHWAGVCKLSRKTIYALAVSGLLAIVLFIAYFAYSHISRVGADTASYGANPVTRQMPDLNSPVLAAIPDDMKPGGVALVNYLTTGYYGLGLAMDRDVEPMYGAGHSMFLTRNFQRLTNDPGFENRSLPIQISDKDGFKYPVFWCTAYPYFANDLGFLGTVIMLFFIGRALATSWIDALGGKNPYAVVMCSLLLTFVFYLPATNRMLQDGEGVATFYVWLLIWGLSRIRSRSGAPALQPA
jgi:hypothetical protein